MEKMIIGLIFSAAGGLAEAEEAEREKEENKNIALRLSGKYDL